MGICKKASFRSIEIAQSPCRTRLKTLFKQSILKCCFLRYLFRGRKLMTGLNSPVFFFLLEKC